LRRIAVTVCIPTLNTAIETNPGRATGPTSTLSSVDVETRDSGVRLAELLAAFSLATDLGLGQPMEHVLRSWVIAARLGERVGVAADDRGALYYVATLGWVGCVADTPEVAAWFGDDIAFRRSITAPRTGTRAGAAGIRRGSIAKKALDQPDAWRRVGSAAAGVAAPVMAWRTHSSQ
jgi:hypothetical protein